jgi:hypothetical protein
MFVENRIIRDKCKLLCACVITLMLCVVETGETRVDRHNNEALGKSI